VNTEQRREWHAYGGGNGKIYIKCEETGQANTPYNKAYLATYIGEHQQQEALIHLRISLQDLEQIASYTRLPSNATPLDVEAEGDTPTDEVMKLIYDRKAVSQFKPRRQNRTRRKVRQQKRVNQDFEAYLQQLDPWENELLSYVNLKYDIFTTYGKMQEEFHAAADGSIQRRHSGSFGWTVSTTNGDRLIKAYGPVRGGRPTSYRAEGYGMLSILRFLKHIQTFCNVTPTWKWTLSSDNISLVNKVNGKEDDDEGNTDNKQFAPHDWSNWSDTSTSDIEDPSHNWEEQDNNAQPNPTMMPDWDVINEIMWTLQNDAVEGGEIFHIAGHQDRKKAYATLNLQAQLNVDADRLASEYQELYGQALPMVLRFPHTAAQLHLLHHGTCTYRYPQMLRRSETERPLLEYIEKEKRTNYTG
jgi:hypothetical protein